MLNPEKDRFTPLPVGRYYGEIVKIKYFLSKVKKTPGIAFTIEILTGKNKGQKHIENYWLSPSALSRLASFCVAAGRRKPFEETDVEETWNAMGGKRLKFEIEHQDYKGNTQASISKVAELNKKEKMKLKSIERKAPVELNLEEAGFSETESDDNYETGGGELMEDIDDDDIPF